MISTMIATWSRVSRMAWDEVRVRAAQVARRRIDLLKYQVGLAWAFVPSVYLDAGWAGENGANKNNAPISYTFNGPYVGLGFLIPF